MEAVQGAIKDDNGTRRKVGDAESEKRWVERSVKRFQRRERDVSSESNLCGMDNWVRTHFGRRVLRKADSCI